MPLPTYVHTHACMYPHAMHRHIHICYVHRDTHDMHTDIRAYTHSYTHIQNKSVYAHVPTHIHFIYAHRGASVHACIHIHVHTHTACPASGTYPSRSSWKLRKPAGKGCRPAFFSPQPAKAGAVKSHSHKELRPANTRVSLEGVFPQQCLQMKAS